jgi:hypothetical protein
MNRLIPCFAYSFLALAGILFVAPSANAFWHHHRAAYAPVTVGYAPVVVAQPVVAAPIVVARPVVTAGYAPAPGCCFGGGATTTATYTPAAVTSFYAPAAVTPTLVTPGNTVFSPVPVNVRFAPASVNAYYSPAPANMVVPRTVVGRPVMVWP